MKRRAAASRAPGVTVRDVWEALDILRLTLEWCMMVSLLPDQACRPDRELDREDSIEVFWPTSLS